MQTLTAALAATSILLAAGAHSALGAQPRQVAPGVFADPGTPAGKQYALQLQQARGTGASPPSSSQPDAQRFGAGIASSRESPTQPAARPATSNNASASKPVHPSVGGTTTTPGAPEAGLSVRSGSGGGGGGTVALVGGAALILVISGMGALLVRRRRPFGPSVERPGE